jgi:hypothetical protein
VKLESRLGSYPGAGLLETISVLRLLLLPADNYNNAIEDQTTEPQRRGRSKITDSSSQDSYEPRNDDYLLLPVA